jgi:hypothetical protein
MMVIRHLAVAVLVIALAIVLPTSAWCGRNMDGALIVHTESGVTYTDGYDYCDINFENPGSCIAANTEVDVPAGDAAVIWLLAAFPAGSSPGVTVIRFGVQHTLSPMNIVSYESCGTAGIEIPDGDFPASDTGMSLGFYPSAYSTLFPFYWFAIAGNSGDTFGTTVSPSSGLADFTDEGSPPEMDGIDRFGYVRWGSTGDNDCPPSVERREATLGEIKAGYRR